MEKGSLRCDANISLRPKGALELGTKSELKNMNSFKGVKDALHFEIGRQKDLLDNGQAVIQETRLWDVKEARTVSMRTKEEAKDYRYFPEPDLPPFLITQDEIAAIKKTIPELPEEKKLRFMKEYGLSDYDAGILVASKEYADITEQRIKEYPYEDKKPIVNWSIGPILESAGTLKCGPAQLKIPGDNAELITLIRLVEDGKISNLTAKAVFNESVAGGQLASKIIQEKNLFQISDTDSLDKIALEVIDANPKSVADFRSGKVNALMFLVGQVMKRSQGKANPKAVQEILKRRLDNA
jgi:aspartyl-tRNA(Asn)/glutamyl-tRNA(Gln) amidotransferase subunit B